MSRPVTEFVIPDGPKPACVMRIDADLSDAIKEIARKCMLTDTAVLSRIVRDALPYIKLTERKVYEMGGDGE